MITNPQKNNTEHEHQLNWFQLYFCDILIPFRIAIQALVRNKGRTALTILGIVIGIMAVITVMSAGDGLEAYVVDQIKTFGTDMIQTEVKIPNTSHESAGNIGGMAMGIQVTTMTLDDMAAIDRLPNIRGSYATIIGQEVTSYQGANKQALIWGASASFINLDPTEVVEGRFYTEEEDKSLVQVAVIGQTVKDKLFANEDPLGKLIKIGRLKFQVIGVMEKRGSITFFDMDNLIYLPVRTLQKKIMGINHVISITSYTYDNSIADQTAEEITYLMRQRHNITSDNPDKDDFDVMTMAEALAIYDTIFGAINLLLIAIAGISLVVGGVGIMNIMYVSVVERTYEIGLRKSVGATNHNILWQFLWEAIVITFFGAIIGFIIGVGLSFLVSIVATSQGIGWRFIIAPSSIVLAISVSLAIGLVFGVFPAMTAAKLDPVKALRYSK